MASAGFADLNAGAGQTNKIGNSDAAAEQLFRHLFHAGSIAVTAPVTALHQT
jgi:hypothetical protein